MVVTMNTKLRQSSRFLLAGAIAAGLSVPALAGAAESEQVNNDPAATKALYGQIYDQFKDGDINRGDSFKLGDRDATLCMMGDGYGIRALAAGANTSCEFAGEVFGALITDITPKDNARAETPSMVHAHSPVTGQDYDMKCVTGQDDLITCTGGVGAAVYLF